MNCSVCGKEAKYIGERQEPGEPEAKKGFCGVGPCWPKESGWKLYLKDPKDYEAPRRS